MPEAERRMTAEIPFVLQVLLLGGLTLASATDVKWGKIPNWLTLTGILIGLSCNAYLGGREELMRSVLGVVLGVGLLFIPYVMGGMGGGDVKLLGMIGSFTGPMATLLIFLSSAIIGMIVSLLLILVVPRYRRSWAGRVRLWLGREQPASDDRLPSGKVPRIALPYGAVLAAGTLFFLYLSP